MPFEYDERKFSEGCTATPMQSSTILNNPLQNVCINLQLSNLWEDEHTAENSCIAGICQQTYELKGAGTKRASHLDSADPEMSQYSIPWRSAETLE